VGRWIDAVVRKQRKKKGIFYLGKSDFLSTSGKWLKATGDELCMGTEPHHPIAKGINMFKLYFPWSDAELRRFGIAPFLCSKHFNIAKSFKDSPGV
jgi:hypothetical protein